MYDFILGKIKFQFDEAFVKNSSSSLSSVQRKKTSFIVVRAGNQMWPIVVFEVATECTEVKFTCTTCDTCEMKKKSQNLW